MEPSSSVTPSISVVVATYNRSKTLQQTLRHLDQQSLTQGSFEVIIVDDGSTDDTVAMIEAFETECRFEITLLSHPNRGPGYTQNRGILAARAELIVLTADDIFLETDALAAHLEFHRRHPEKETAALGRVLQSPTLNQTVFLSKWDPWRLGGLPDGQVLPYYMFWACHISFKRDFMVSRGMFRDERGRGGAAAHEDAELGYRLFQHGLKIVHLRAALAYHHHVETLEGTLRRSYERGRNWHDFRERVPQLEVDVAYRVYGVGTLIGRRKELQGSRRAYLHDADKSLLRLALRWAVRGTVFNQRVVERVWLPLFAQAERRTWIAALVDSRMYRGVVLHYFLRGCRDGRASADEPAPIHRA